MRFQSADATNERPHQATDLNPRAKFAVYTPIDSLTMSLAGTHHHCTPLAGAEAHDQPSPRSRPNLQETLALVIPTLREAENLPGLLLRVREALDRLGLQYEVLVVDDDSRDGTAEIVTAIAEEDARVRLLVRKGQTGLSGAVLHGWQHTDAEMLGAMDADMQHPPELLPDLVDAIASGCDLAIGSRYTSGGALGRWNPARRFLSNVAVWMTAPIQRPGLRASDPMSGYFFVRRECLEGIAFQQEGFKLLLDILVRARIRSLKEVPFRFGRRSRGVSKANLKVARDFACLLARLYRARFSFRKTIPFESLGRQEAD